MELGTVITTFEGPSTTNFSFVLTTGNVRKGQFVQVNTDDGLLMGLILDITRANRYFERAESVAEYERSGSMILNFPITDWEYTVANVRIIGVLKNNNIMRNAFPPAPGGRVFSADEVLLKDFVGFVDDGLHLGKLENHNVDAKISLTRLLQKHLAILAISGSGKSYLSGVLIEELVDRKPEHGRLAVIVVDIHGEYIGFKSGPYADKTKIFKGNDIRIALHKISPQLLYEFLPELSIAQKRYIGKLLHVLKERKNATNEGYSLADLILQIESSEEIKDSVKGPLIGSLYSLKTMKLFGKVDSPGYLDLAQQGKVSILDLSDLDNLKKKQLIVAYFAKKLFRLRKKGGVPPFLLVLEEAHNFAREKASKHEVISKGIVETIAGEGRKFGASLCLISQRPVQLSTTALSQCNTNIILRVTNPYDIDHIGESCESIDKSMLNSISTLRVGEALIVGEAVNHPIFIKIRERRSKRLLKGDSLEAMARQFEEKEEKKKQDVEAFL
ncbi:ATP-binding protein [Candidatus Micrarchaeota archaeon]|nr:ATP-binding protein [Candidatus Micrarchaeota archaeon]